MKLKEVENFISNCVEHNVEIPKGLTFVIEDFDRVVPSEWRSSNPLEYNMRGNGQRVYIVKPKEE